MNYKIEIKGKFVKISTDWNWKIFDIVNVCFVKTFSSS